jgi:hypothetical protein
MLQLVVSSSLLQRIPVMKAAFMTVDASLLMYACCKPTPVLCWRKMTSATTQNDVLCCVSASCLLQSAARDSS